VDTIIPHEAHRRAYETAERIKRSCIVDGHDTSVSLEDEFWAAIKQFAAERHVKIDKVLEAAKANVREPQRRFSSGVRVYCLTETQKQRDEYRELLKQLFTNTSYENIQLVRKRLEDMGIV
jgi:predicted DNA-binding ribbon-helix-helix protein